MSATTAAYPATAECGLLSSPVIYSLDSAHAKRCSPWQGTAAKAAITVCTMMATIMVGLSVAPPQLPLASAAPSTTLFSSTDIQTRPLRPTTLGVRSHQEVPSAFSRPLPIYAHDPDSGMHAEPPLPYSRAGNARESHPLVVTAPVVAGTSIAFVVLLLKFASNFQEKWKNITTPEEPDPAIELHEVGLEVVELLIAQAEDEIRSPSAATYHLDSDACCMRMPGKEGEWELQPWRGAHYCDLDCGEDSFVVTPRLIGVADGVGGWRDEGVDPAIFANKMMENVKGMVEGQDHLDVHDPIEGADEFRDHPAMLMHKAYTKLVLGNEVDYGSATCCLAALCPDGTLQVANMGDSNLLVFRGKECVFESETNTYSFNAPFQLEVPFKSYNTVVSEAALENVQVQDGDTIVVASDGLYDNLFNEEIGQILDDNKDLSTHDLAVLLKERAAEIGADEEKVTPFELACQKAKFEWSGGKEDDITVIVARVKKD